MTIQRSAINSSVIIPRSIIPPDKRDHLWCCVVCEERDPAEVARAHNVPLEELERLLADFDNYGQGEATTQEALVRSMGAKMQEMLKAMTAEKIKEANLSELAKALGTINYNRRLEDNKTTENIGVGIVLKGITRATQELEGELRDGAPAICMRTEEDESFEAEAPKIKVEVKTSTPN